MAADLPRPGSSRSYRRAKKMMEDADRTKEREFYRYYHHGGLSRQPSPAVGIPQSLPSSSPLPPQACVPRPGEDKAMAAFAQLGALRLNTRRCLISFFDRRNCYILAEATKTMSLQTGQAEFIEDGLCWGCTTFPKEKSICYYTVNLPVEHSGMPLDDYSDVPSLVVNDLSLDNRFKNYPFVLGPPHSRFYAGVPIRSPNGLSIGTYCVLDDKPREGISSFELSFLKDMAVTVMRHLEMTRATDDHRRGGIMVRSLGSFAEGKSSLEDWWHDPWEPEPSSPIVSLESTSVPRQRRPTFSSAAPPRMDLQEPLLIDRNDSANSSVPSLKSPHATSPSTGPPASAVVTPASEIITEHRTSEVATKTASSTKDDQRDRVAPEIKTAFSRAAGMIVDATEAEGTVFFDAKISTFGGLVENDDDLLSDQPESDKLCTVLGVALSKNIDFSVSSNCQYNMSESVLRHLLRTYSHGQIFNLDEDVTTAQTSPIGADSESADAFPFNVSRRSESSRSQDDENLLREIFPKARSLVMYPLWDPHRDRWFASAIIWSSDPKRVFTSEQELSYLAAFSNSIMAEVARLDTKLADAAKADFISSISHELRSPLHGILGMTDLLKDTPIDTQQTNQVQTIETCGKTLLDTINHVLDFAKINNLTRGTSKRQKKRSQSTKHVINPGEGHTNDITTIITDVDMCSLTEEALESVFAGYHFQKSATETIDGLSNKNDVPPIAVIVDINKSDNYVFRTQPGAWRRVIMNLFGNALKYTTAGYIKVKLQVEPSSDADSAGRLSEFRLVVTDSGIGMSEDYVNNRLFHSFAQENPLSQGTGLGLSIVKQIVEVLGGDIEVRSEKGRGTKFTVSCDLKQSIMSPPFSASAPNKENELLAIKKRTEDMSVCFVGFEEEDEYFVKSLKNKNATKLTLKALENLCLDWFSMKPTQKEKDGWPKTPAPDLFVATESGAKLLRTQYSKDPDIPTAPVIVICQGAASAQSTTAITVPGMIFECVAQPIGPHKLAKALASSLDRHTNRVMAKATETDTPLSKVSTLNLKENTPPISPNTLSTILEPSRPPIMSALSAPEVRSVNNSPVKKKIVPHRALNCLAVDDNPINLRLLRTFVEKLGHQHVLAKNGLEALEAFKSAQMPFASSSTLTTSESPSPPPTPSRASGSASSSRVDVILMDINMPEMDGLEATRQIRAHEISHSLSPVTIIALTGVASAEAQQEAYSSGVNLFLIKPVRLADLDVVLRGVVTGEDREKEKENENQGAKRDIQAPGGEDSAKKEITQEGSKEKKENEEVKIGESKEERKTGDTHTNAPAEEQIKTIWE